MICDLDHGQQVILINGYLQVCANRGSLGVRLTPEQMQEIGLTLWLHGRRAKRAKP